MVVTAGSAPATSSANSRCMPSGPAVSRLGLSERLRCSSAGSSKPSEPSVARSAAVREVEQQNLFRCGRLVISPQLLQQRLRRRPQPAADAREGHGAVRLERVAPLAEEDTLLVLAEHQERHRAGVGCARARAVEKRGSNDRRMDDGRWHWLGICASAIHERRGMHIRRS
eukprot:scaffold93544_cov72-Phaeocystis_antarctica.AAC.4